MYDFSLDYGPNVAAPNLYRALSLYCVRCKRLGYALPLARYRKALLSGYAPEWLDRLQ